MWCKSQLCWCQELCWLLENSWCWLGKRPLQIVRRREILERWISWSISSAYCSHWVTMQQSMLNSNSHSQLTLHSSSCPLLIRDGLAQNLICQSSPRNKQMQSTRYSEAHGSRKFFSSARPRLQGKLRQCRVAAQSSLRTPHSGYHFDGSDRRFFEGWYFKVGILAILILHQGQSEFPVWHVDLGAITVVMKLLQFLTFSENEKMSSF